MPMRRVILCPPLVSHASCGITYVNLTLCHMVTPCWRINIFNFWLARAKVFTMAKAKEFSVEVRRVIIDYHNNGMGYWKISNEFNILIGTITAIIWKWKQYGLTKDLVQTWHIRKLNERADRSTICPELKADSLPGENFRRICR